MKRNSFLIIFMSACLFFGRDIRAQFYKVGNDNGFLKWNSISTGHYKIIYPEGRDSTASEYARELEKYWNCVGVSAGFNPGESYGKKFPVILHTDHVDPNGMVLWAPMRMNLYTLPPAYSPSSCPWSMQLAVHESRHVSQMQFVNSGGFKYMNYFFGEMLAASLSAIYPNLHLLEGDAVVTETVLTKFGRGRSHDFLEYYKYAFDNGDFRSWGRWRYGSYKKYAPNHYALGYLTIAGTRYCYDDPFFSKRYFSSVVNKPWRFFNMQRTVREASGKNFDKSFREIEEAFIKIWRKNSEQRAPFDSACVYYNPSPSLFLTYKNLVPADGGIYAIKYGQGESGTLVFIDDSGNERQIRPFETNISRLKMAGNRLWWSEKIPDIRWELQSSSRIRYFDLSSGTIKDFTSSGNYFNPDISPDGTRLAAVSYDDKGKTSLVVFATDDKKICFKIEAPPGMQMVTPVWSDDKIIISAITRDGMGLYIADLSDGSLSELMPPSTASMDDLGTFKDDKKHVFFSSDLNGSREFHQIDIDSATAYRLTSLKYGGHDFCFSKDRCRLFFTSVSDKGYFPNYLETKKMNPKKVDLSDVSEDEIVSVLTKQELNILKENKINMADDSGIKISAPEKFNKYSSIFNFHSWAPFYMDNETISNMSFESLSSRGGPGATVFFNSILDDASGTVGYLISKNPDTGGIAHRLTADFEYRGWYPVIRINASIGGRNAVSYKIDANKKPKFYKEIRNIPYMRGAVQAYLPMNFSSSGWLKGIIPSLTYSINNDGYESYCKNILVNTFLRGFSVLKTPVSKVYPKFGIGGTLGYVFKTDGMNFYSPSVYADFYTYLPGIVGTQGMRVSVKTAYSVQKNKLSLIYNLPRGFSSSQYIPGARFNMLASLDYSIPVYVGDIDFIHPVLYIKNFELRPHADYSFGIMPSAQVGMCSVGTEVNVHTANLFFIPYGATIGFDYNCNFVNNPGYLQLSKFSRHKFSFVFRIWR